MNNNITGTIVQLNEYPPDKFNVLIPVTTMQVMSNLQRIIVNKVQLDVADPENSKDIYREKSSGKYAITKVGGMKLAAAANISIVETESGMTDGCKRCVDMARAVGKPKACGTCPARYDVAVTVTIRVPEPSGGFRLMKATKEIDCAAEKESMTEAQYKRFLPHRTAMAESKASVSASTPSPTPISCGAATRRRPSASEPSSAWWRRRASPSARSSRRKRTMSCAAASSESTGLAYG